MWYQNWCEVCIVFPHVIFTIWSTCKKWMTQRNIQPFPRLNTCTCNFFANVLILLCLLEKKNLASFLTTSVTTENTYRCSPPPLGCQTLQNQAATISNTSDSYTTNSFFSLGGIYDEVLTLKAFSNVITWLDLQPGLHTFIYQ